MKFHVRTLEIQELVYGVEADNPQAAQTAIELTDDPTNVGDEIERRWVRKIVTLVEQED